MRPARESQSSDADRHDLDNLARRKAGLDAAADSAGAETKAAVLFVVCAIFPVSAQYRAARDIFRRYRFRPWAVPGRGPRCWLGRSG